MEVLVDQILLAGEVEARRVEADEVGVELEDLGIAEGELGQLVAAEVQELAVDDVGLWVALGQRLELGHHVRELGIGATGGTLHRLLEGHALEVLG